MVVLICDKAVCVQSSWKGGCLFSASYRVSDDEYTVRKWRVHRHSFPVQILLLECTGSALGEKTSVFHYYHPNRVSFSSVHQLLRDTVSFTTSAGERGERQRVHDQEQIGLLLPQPTCASSPTWGLRNSSRFLSLDYGTASACETRFVLWWGPIYRRLVNQMPQYPCMVPYHAHNFIPSNFQHRFSVNMWCSIIQCFRCHSYA
jgi:hypothetical protein